MTKSGYLGKSINEKKYTRFLKEERSAAPQERLKHMTIEEAKSRTLESLKERGILREEDPKV